MKAAIKVFSPNGSTSPTQRSTLCLASLTIYSGRKKKSSKSSNGTKYDAHAYPLFCFLNSSHAAPIYVLPADIENIETYYEIRKNDSMALTSEYLEDDYHHEEAYSKKHQAFCDRPFILRSANPKAFDFAPLASPLADTNSDGRLLELIKEYIKVIPCRTQSIGSIDTLSLSRWCFSRPTATLILTLLWPP